MANALVRTISGLALLAYLALVVYLGQDYCIASIAILGLLVVSEFVRNFLKLKLISVESVLSSFIYLMIFFVFFNWKQFEVSAAVGFIFNVTLLFYLFSSSLYFKNFAQTKRRTSSIVFSIYIAAIMSTFAGLILRPDWKSETLLLVLTASMMDIGAWCFGKSIGRHKLWPSVSPNKTIEGLLGGILTASVSVFFAFKYLYGIYPKLTFVIIFPILSFFSQIGDLVQSKIKRQFEIKDSSNLIPGHGGVYDRFDSYIFIIPIFFLVMKLL